MLSRKGVIIIDALSEMLKGILEGLILEIINNNEVYGYEIVRKLNALGLTGIVEGTVYTVLMRLEKNNMVDIIKRPSELGPPRKFYTLNDKGKKELKVFWEKWEFLSQKIELIRKGEVENGIK